MPYTPPSQLSPAASQKSTPTPSRSPSYSHVRPEITSPERPQLPRSAGSSSYLNRSRRSPASSFSRDEHAAPMTDSQRGINIDPHGSMRQSPPPVTNGIIPTGMTISPPDSSNNSDDEENRGRGRDIENLKELQAAISQIQVRKASSPNRGEPATTHDKAAAIKQAALALEGLAPVAADGRPPLSKEARKISHSRSSTDSNIVFESPTQIRLSPPSPFQDSLKENSDSDEYDGPADRPTMVRKKSGELVRPALRPSSRRRPSSMPGTPTYSKAVHFDSHLEHVRHFLQVDRPLAVSAGSSPVEAYESENEFPFGSDESSARPRPSVYEWEIRLANFPTAVPTRQAQPVCVERVFLSSDQKNLVGTVAVQNLAFQKQVTARFTLDYWKTTSETIADFNNDVRRRQQNGDELDRFNFSIRLADQANLENKTLFFCIRYAVNGQDFWDNNSGYNYQVDFTRKAKASPKQQPSGLGARPVNTLPRSRPSPPTSSSSNRPTTAPAGPAVFDDFGANFDNFGTPFGQVPTLVAEPKIKLRSPRSKGELVPDAPMRRNKSTPLFGHRYDFNSSLTAAKNSAFAALGEQSGLSARTETKQSSRTVPADAASKSVTDAPQRRENGVRSPPAEQPSTLASAAAAETLKPAAALVSEKPPLTSPSYQELVEKYCFYQASNNITATGKSAKSRGGTSALDGANDDLSNSDLSGSARSSGSSTPNGGPSSSPSTEVSPVLSRASSPMPRTGSCLGSRSASPAAFSYFYPQSSSQTLLAEAPAATAIQG